MNQANTFLKLKMKTYLCRNFNTLIFIYQVYMLLQPLGKLFGKSILEIAIFQSFV